METQLNGLYRSLGLGCQGAIPKTVLRLPGVDRNPLLETRLIIRVQGEGPYSWLYTSDGKRCLVSLTLGHLTRDLSHFVRVHKSHLVNPAFALRVVMHDKRRWLRLTTGEKLPLSRRVKVESGSSEFCP